MKCPKCKSEEIYLEDGPNFGHGCDEEIYNVWQCEECGARWAASYELNLIDIEILEEGYNG